MMSVLPLRALWGCSVDCRLLDLVVRICIPEDQGTAPICSVISLQKNIIGYDQMGDLLLQLRYYGHRIRFAIFTTEKERKKVCLFC